MSALVLLLWVANATLDTVGQIAFKYAATKQIDSEGMNYWLALSKQPWLWIGIFAYIFEFLLWLAFLTLVPLSQGVLLAAINIITIMIAGRILFSEKLTPLRVTGIVLVTIGVVVIGVF